jgi:YgiT-type zinc finger domain-containing protein
MKCINCGQQGARQKLTPRIYGKGEKLLIIEDVPVITCPHCGESYMEIDTVRKLERLRDEGASNAPRRNVGVLAYS